MSVLKLFRTGNEEHVSLSAAHAVPLFNTRDMMYQSIRLAGLLCFGMMVSVAYAEEDPLLLESRSLVKTFATRLTGELTKAIEKGGPVLAIGVCKDIAPQIASELSRKSGAKVSRTSTRYRNPANAPEPWQREVLERFAKEMSSADGAQPPEYFERGSGNEPIRYARAIPAGGMCLLCHGKNVPGEVSKILDAEYPFDQARGYELGDLRGAFSVSWPSEEKSQ